MKKNVIIGIGVLVLLVGGYFTYKTFSKAKQQIVMETADVIRGDINETITATGTLEALETVEVGTQVSGVIEKIYVDYNTQVKKGQLLAKIDQTPLLATLEQSKATVDNAKAEVDYQKSNYDRYKVLAEKKLIAQSDFDLVIYNYQKAQATLKNAQSVYDKNKINLDYATIYSPIDGIILDRAVDEGQTVAASFSTPTLFTIANDLTQMQVEASVDEADIGKVKTGQRVEFTVDAFPDMQFEGKVTEIRLQPVESSNVITYTVIISAPNPEKKLMVGMTANVSFYVTEMKNIVLLPAKALNFEPNPELIMSYEEQHPEIKFEKPTPPAQGNPSEIMPTYEKESNGEAYETKMIWVKENNTIRMQKVVLGETNELYYQVISGVTPKEQVLISLRSDNTTATSNSSSEAARSPFMPQRPGGNRK